MRKHGFIASVTSVIMLLLISISMNAQPTTYPETVYRHKAEFPRIFRSGELSSQVQLCDPKSVCVGTGLFIMEKASVGEVEKCRLYLYVVKDTIRSVRIVAKGRDNVEALQREVFKEFGEPVQDKAQNGKAIYKWPDRWHDGTRITTQLVISNKEAEFREWFNTDDPPVTGKW